MFSDCFCHCRCLLIGKIGPRLVKLLEPKEENMGMDHTFLNPPQNVSTWNKTNVSLSQVELTHYLVWSTHFLTKDFFFFFPLQTLRFSDFCTSLNQLFSLFSTNFSSNFLIQVTKKFSVFTLTWPHHFFSTKFFFFFLLLFFCGEDKISEQLLALYS